MTILFAALAVDLAFMSLIIFVLLVLILFKLFAKPIATGMRRRAETIAEALRQADVARAETEKVLADLQQQRAKARAQARELIEAAKRDAELTRKNVLVRAKVDADTLRARSEREIRLATQAALQELWSTTANLSLAIAERMLQATLDASDQRRLIDQALVEIGQSARGAA